MKTNNIGRLTCPICNEPNQDLRVDKGGKLYMYCDNFCAIKFNGKMSKKYLSLLKQGQSIQLEKIGVITSLKQKEYGKNELQWTQPRTATGNNNTRADFDGRNDGQSSGVRTDNKSSGRFWRRVLVDDNEE